jgi:hypothetical protein
MSLGLPISQVPYRRLAFDSSFFSTKGIAEIHAQPSITTAVKASTTEVKFAPPRWKLAE